jgi:cell division septal protein FtsQ
MHGVQRARCRKIVCYFMSTTPRSRDERRTQRTSRTPGIYRGRFAPQPNAADLEPIQHGTREGFVLGARVVSGLIALALIVVLLVFFAADAFYVTNITTAGLQYLTKEEIYTVSGVAGLHVFWLDPTEIRENILQFGSVADVDVQVGWPPNGVQIIVEERQPALIWEQGGTSVWIDLQGRVMAQRADLANLPRVTVNGLNEPMTASVRLDPQVVAGALQLRELLPEMQNLRYVPERGLGYNDPRGWEVWFGVGTDMPEKILIYNAIVADNQARGITPSVIDVADPDAPKYCCRTGQ